MLLLYKDKGWKRQVVFLWALFWICEFRVRKLFYFLWVHFVLNFSGNAPENKENKNHLMWSSTWLRRWATRACRAEDGGNWLAKEMHGHELTFAQFSELLFLWRRSWRRACHVFPCSEPKAKRERHIPRLSEGRATLYSIRVHHLASIWLEKTLIFRKFEM